MKRWLGLAVIPLLLTACGPTAGPLGRPGSTGKTGSWSGGGVRSGQFFVTAIPLAQRPRNKPAVLLSARPFKASDARGLTIRYAAVKAPSYGMSIGGARGWKPKAWGLRTLPGFVVGPDERAAVVVGATSSRPGHYFIRSFVIEYLIGSRHYRAIFDQGLEVCVGADHCPSWTDPAKG